MSRYARAIYGHGKYGLNLAAEHSVEPMLATVEIDPLVEPVHARKGSSSFTDARGRAIYNRVQVSWLAPSNYTRMVLLRSNVGYPTGPTDPYARIVIDTLDPELPEPITIHRLRSDVHTRNRVAYLDHSVDQGREYFYAIWVMTGDESLETDVWHLSGRATVTTSIDHGTLDTLKQALPPYMWNLYHGPGHGVSVLEEPDDENTMTRWLQATAWELDKTMTKADLLRKIWDPQHTPAVLLDEATSMFGLPVEPALGARAGRALLANAATISGERGTRNAIELLVESLSGFLCETTVGTNILPSTDESSFEGLMLDRDGNVMGGTGRWYTEGATLHRIPGDPANIQTRIARDPNPDEPLDSRTRFGLGLIHDMPAAGITMSLGERVRISRIKSGDSVGVVSTAWPHGLEAGDVVKISVPGRTSGPVELEPVLPVDDFNLQIKVPAALADLDEDITDGWFEGGPIPTYQGVPVKALSAYSLVGMFQAPDSDDVTLTLNYWSRSGDYLGSTVATADEPVPSTGWTRVNASGTAPEGAVSATLIIEGQVTGVDSIMVRQGGTRYDGVTESGTLPYDTATPYDGDMDYTFEDAQILTLTFDTSKTPTGGEIPFTIRADMAEVLRSRLTDILTAYLPIGTAFRIILV